MSRRRSPALAHPAVAPSAALALSCLLVLLLPVLAAARPAATSAGKPKKAVVQTGAKSPGARGGSAASRRQRASRVSRPRASSARRTLASRARRPALHTARPVGRVYVDEHIHVRSGDTLEHILAVRGLAGDGAQPWLAAADAVYDLRKVRPRHGVGLRFDRVSREIESIRYEIDEDSLLVLERDGEDVHARIEALPYVREVSGIAGHIETGLREDATEAGVPPSVAAALGDLFGWDLDVENGLEPGDGFRVIYENIWEVGRAEPLTGIVVGAEIVTRGRRYTAVFFEDDAGGAYYRPDGGAVSRAFLRYPVQFTEISSEFSQNRFHPILHRDRPHLGVDFAAPQGTPVRAAATGTVRVSGWQGGLGRTVRLEHEGEVTTTYGHLGAIAPAVHAGARIERGQVVGWVGATGLATGPHLHYEIERAGEHLDPMAVTAVKDPPVADDKRRAFERVRTTVTRELARLPESDAPVRIVLSSNAWRAE